MTETQELPEQTPEEMKACQDEVNKLDNTPYVEGGTGIDMQKYKGLKVKIESVVRDDAAINYYNGPVANGKPSYNADSIEVKSIIIVETYPLPVLDETGNTTTKQASYVDKEGKEKMLTVKARFNLTLDKATGTWGISKSPQAKLYKFLRKQGVKKLSELKDTIVLLDVEPDRDIDSDRFWLRFSQ